MISRGQNRGLLICVSQPINYQTDSVTRKSKEEALAELESNQAELRKNIEKSNELIARSDKLLDRYREERDEERAAANQGGS